MKIKFSKSAVKFLEKQNEKTKERIRLKLKGLTLTIESGIIPFRDMNIKRLHGEWKDFMKLRIGRIRVIFRIDKQKDEIYIYEIDYRGGIYK